VHVPQPLAQLVRGCENQMPDLIQVLDADVATRTTGNQQHADRFHITVGRLGDPRGSTRQRRPSGFDRIEGVRLPTATSGLTVRSIDLDDREPAAAQMTSQAGPVSAGAFHTDTVNRSERRQPAIPPVVADGGRFERFNAQHSAVAVHDRRDVHIRVRVNTTSDRARALYDGHRHPFCVQSVKGWHARPGKETVAIDLFAQADQSPSGTGRAQFGGCTPFDRHQIV
jgi:hypothetical protein